MGVWPLEQLFLREEVLLESQTMCNVLSEFHTNIRQWKTLRHPNTGYQTTLRQNAVSCLACRTLGTGTFHFHYLNISYIKLFLRIHVTGLFLILMKSTILWWINLIKTSCFGVFFVSVLCNLWKWCPEKGCRLPTLRKRVLRPKIQTDNASILQHLNLMLCSEWYESKFRNIV